MKLRDITNNKCDVREYMNVDFPDWLLEQLKDEIDFDIIEALKEHAAIYVKHESLETEIEPFDIYKKVEEG
ncbi:hypothetical protein KQY53_000620 [Listeria monocytogenes]|uniref:hypothetical protein n=1 Tax=Listeria seeligeri TaxID=1640 RepID=UPI000F92CBE9|nr:hypothetical protein [Listeria seeligeri]EAC2775638.1 hypothetical protein [Listeria monocytogenes]EAC4094709.1 hypothetical protein [Listeria monocytogenes]EAC4698831.1 hypothetical protein [Listeria monocytogenes]EAC6718385.1 hypothetical protein [Listeria monocytogenes]EAC7537296.1 hypothetical protein [Listeria monocytogenes]